jgi:hypothetical protein
MGKQSKWDKWVSEQNLTQGVSILILECAVTGDERWILYVNLQHNASV